MGGTWIDLNLTDDYNQEIQKVIEAGKKREKDIEQIVQTEVSNWQASEEYEWMNLGEKYYRNETEIKERVRKAVGESGTLEPVANLANNKLATPFTRKLTDQKVGYLLSKPMSIQTQRDDYRKKLGKYFDKAFMRQIQTLGKNAINAGISWLHPYYDESGEMKFTIIPSWQCIPFWKDMAHTELDAMIRWYQVEVYEGATKKLYTKYEWWDKTGVRRYVVNGNGFAPDIEAGEFTPHVYTVDSQGKKEGLTWERIPFIAFKYNDDEMPLIQIIKSLVDDYDKQKSDIANNLEDLPNSIYKVTNYGDVDAASFRKNIALYRVVFVNNDGDVDTVNIEIDTEAYKYHQEQNRKDIYEAGRGVDTQADKLGNSSGVALKFLYADLDMDCNIIENEFQAALEQLLWFINTDLKNKGEGDFFNETVDFVFNRDIVINETEAVENAQKSKGVISDETIISNHPWVTNANEEMERMKEQEEQALKAFNGQFSGLEEDEPNGDETS